MEEENQYDAVKSFIDSSKNTDINKDKDFADEEKYRHDMRFQQIRRAEIVSDIFENYKIQQCKRYEYKRDTKPIIFWFLIGIIIALTASFIVWIGLLFGLYGCATNQALVGLIASCITYLSSLISLFLIIIKYVFPTDEEKNFNDLVSAIITNDTTRIKNENDYLTQRQEKNN